MLWLLLSIFGLFLGLISAGIGWMGYGSIIFGIPALILVIISAIKEKEKYRTPVLILMGLTFVLVAVGIIETIIMGAVVSGLEEVVNTSTSPTATPGPSGKITAQSSNVTLIDYRLSFIESKPTVIANIHSNFDGYAYLYKNNASLDEERFSKDKRTIYLQAGPWGCNFEAGDYNIKFKTRDGREIARKDFRIDPADITIDDFVFTVECNSFVCNPKRLSIQIKNTGNSPAIINEIELNVNGDIQTIHKQFIIDSNSAKTIEIFDPDILIQKEDEVKEVTLKDDCGEISTKSVNYLIA